VNSLPRAGSGLYLVGASFDSPTTPAVSLYIVTGNPGTEHQKYNMATDLWVTRNQIPTSRQAGASSSCGGGGASAAALGSTHIYVVGSGFAPPLTYGELNEQYTILTDSWTSRKSMPFGRSGPAAAASGSKLFVAGGCVLPLASSTSKLEVYDASTDAWVTGTCTHERSSRGLSAEGRTLCSMPLVASCMNGCRDVDADVAVPHGRGHHRELHARGRWLAGAANLRDVLDTDRLMEDRSARSLAPASALPRSVC
jgi:hypothetical protein